MTNQELNNLLFHSNGVNLNAVAEVMKWSKNSPLQSMENSEAR